MERPAVDVGNMECRDRTPVRAASPRFQAMLAHWNQWVTTVDWTNDGGSTWWPATFLDGTVVCSSLSQIRWTCDLKITDVDLALDGINGFSTQIRIHHGLPGELLPFGQYKVTSGGYDSDSRGVLQIKGSSHEEYLIRAGFTATRSFDPQPASRLATRLIQEIIPGAPVAWEMDDDTLPKIVEEKDRWGILDGGNAASSIARSLGGRIHAGAAGNWIARPTPTLYDPTVWEASEGEGGVLFSHGESLTDEGVYNTIVAAGQSSTQATFRPGIAQDLDPRSPTYVRKPVSKGGFGPHVLYYSSDLLTSHTKAQKAAEAMLAPRLGLRQQVTFSQAHDPLLEPGDVGIVHTVNGPRRVLPDELTYSLTGEPLTAQTRTTATDLLGEPYVVPDDDGGSS